MPLDDHSEALCFDCESGKYMPTEGAAECHNCSVPICAKELTYCDPIHGGAQQYVYYSTAEANALECLAADPFDVCDLPQYCRDDSAQCRLWPDNRHTMVYPQPCPHLDGPDLRLAKDFSCWDHANFPGGLARGSSSPASLPIAVATAATMNEDAPLNGSSCGMTAVQPQYRYFVIACKANASDGGDGCTDFKIDCPAAVAEDVWWESLADTLYDSNFTTESSVTAYFGTSASSPAFHDVRGRTLHALVNIYEDVNSTAKFGYALKSYLCLSRTKIDTTSPVSPVGPTRLACSPDHCPSASSLQTPAGYLQFSPNASRLKLELASMDDGETLIAYTGVQLLQASQAGPLRSPGDACAAIPLARAVGDGKPRESVDAAARRDATVDWNDDAAGPYALADTDFNFVVDIGSGHEGWVETTPTPRRPAHLSEWPGGSPAQRTDARPEWRHPSTGGWFGASGWNSRLDESSQGEQPMATCRAGEYAYELRFNLSDLQVACGALSLEVVAVGGTGLVVTINGAVLPTPPRPPSAPRPPMAPPLPPLPPATPQNRSKI